MWHGFGRGYFGFGGFNGIEGFNWIGGAVMFAGILLVGLVIYLLIRNSRNNIAVRIGGTSNSQSILNERLAKGEIDKETYNDLTKTIKSS